MRLFFITLILFLVMWLGVFADKVHAQTSPTWWEFQSVDTMKYSRDPSRQFLDNPALADEVIQLQTQVIADVGATHIAIATPYDPEFIPLLKKWIAQARSHGLKIWFRGNWSGWEGWFGYDSISRQQHLELTENFIKDNPDLFENGDVFSACPECENGGPGDPRHNGDAEGHRQFLINEYNAMKSAFRSINKNVGSNFNPMNGDVARLIMDEATTKELGGLVVIDHYVSTPEQLVSDVDEIARTSGGSVILGEFGAPIPDIHGTMTQTQQAAWINRALDLLSHQANFDGLSYWTSFGGSTSIWADDGTPSKAALVLEDYFRPDVISGRVVNDGGKPIAKAHVASIVKSTIADDNGYFQLPYLDKEGEVTVEAVGHESQTFQLTELTEVEDLEIKLQRNATGLELMWIRFKAWLASLFS